MKTEITINRGLDLSIRGGLPADVEVKRIPAAKVALTPDDFPGLTPKLEVKEGSDVAAGQPLMRSKECDRIKLVSPVAGRVSEVKRGERRKILYVSVEVAGASEVPAVKVSADHADELRDALMQSGLWAQMRQRPYDIVPVADAVPRDIFVTAIDSAPLAAPLTDNLDNKTGRIDAALKALKALTSGKVYVSFRPGEDKALMPEWAYSDDRVVVVTVDGRHPAGNAGVQAAALAPVNKGETIWTLDIVTLWRIGSLIVDGRVDWSTSVAVTGSDVKQPMVVETIVGAAVEPLIEGNIVEGDAHRRIISGNVLTGVKTAPDGYLHYPYRQITVIPEGDDVDEFMGWASMSPSKMSESRSFLSKLFGKKQFTPDARVLGGKRAMIMSGLYDKVFPMDIYPEYLLKAIISKDIDKMEQLGIYEVAPEDFALCEYVDPSKIELQKIVREGLDYLRKEVE
ncbi:MAG: Na(+)-translocating NADH-quinone reductase subunit A [Paramuribaculum sp.]|nr:Na(+)-translocating NADH-quinone reductase subunit A [Paramuribaculum sp.]